MQQITSWRRSLTLAAAGALAAGAAVAAARGRYVRAHHLTLASATILLVPTLSRNSGWFGPVIYDFATEKREIWLTIDDGPDPDNTPGILDVLARYEARAAFFVIGQRVRRHPDLARRIVAEGHQIHNHTDSHPARTFWAACPQRVAREIHGGSEAVLQAVGVRPSFFRAPAGLANPFVHAAVEKAGLRMMGWSASGFDGVVHRPENALRRILSQIRPGAIVMIHENQLPGMPLGSRVGMLERLLQELRDRGFETSLPVV